MSMKAFLNVSLLASAVAIAPLSANAGFCGSKNKTYKQGYNGQPMMMYPNYNQAYMMVPPPPMMPQPPAVPVYWQPQSMTPIMAPMNYQQAAYAMPKQPQQYAYGNMSAQAAQLAPAIPLSESADKQPAAEKPSQSSATEGAAQVTISGMQFQPATLKIKVGESVTWKNTANMPHTVTSTNGGELASGQMGNGGEFTHVFKKPGTYTYYCAIHPSMKAQVIVE